MSKRKLEAAQESGLVYQSKHPLIKHKIREDPRKAVKVEFDISGDRIWLAVEDEGPGFDPTAVPDPTEEANLEIPSGRGIMLMRAYMTDVAIVAPGNRVEMTFRPNG